MAHRVADPNSPAPTASPALAAPDTPAVEVVPAVKAAPASAPAATSVSRPIPAVQSGQPVQQAQQAQQAQLGAKPASPKAALVRALARCPACQAPLVFERAIVCTNVHCGSQYAYARNGIGGDVPQLLTAADQTEADALMAHHGAHTVPAFGSRALRWLAPPPPSPCFDPAKNRRLKQFFAGFAADAVLLDIGAQNFNLHPLILNFDMAPFNHTDLIGNAHRLPLQDGSINGIVNTGVLEHVADPDQVVAEMFRVLKPGGLVYVETPFLQGEHPDPLDFRRYTLGGLSRQLTQAGFTVREGGMGCGPGSTWAWIARESFAGLFGGRRSFTVAWAWAGWLTFWLKYLDWPFRRRPYLARLASSYYVIVEKPAAPVASPSASPPVVPAAMQSPGPNTPHPNTPHPGTPHPGTPNPGAAAAAAPGTAPDASAVTLKP